MGEQRLWLGISVALYVAALPLPALRNHGWNDFGPDGAPFTGLDCFVQGLFGVIGVVPFLPWIANVGLWVLWNAEFKRHSVPSSFAWGLPIYAVSALALLCLMLQFKPGIGSFFWVGSLLSGALAVPKRSVANALPAP
ncbi:hypothetical protein EON79_06650 [bacterium]|nr:MAG: hypothetical protein EON79_06650 [bacterium]